MSDRIFVQIKINPFYLQGSLLIFKPANLCKPASLSFPVSGRFKRFYCTRILKVCVGFNNDCTPFQDVYTPFSHFQFFNLEHKNHAKMIFKGCLGFHRKITLYQAFHTFLGFFTPFFHISKFLTWTIKKRLIKC